ncbi:hypothetical protein HY417_03360 [Candidatus Kaiserbacteria bacterium]|nr:hypothetical protein [Candidatus Kaiserbacteria bacterium]
MKEFQTLVPYLVINLITAFLVPLFAAQYQWVEQRDRALFGALIAVSLTAAQILYHVIALRRASAREDSVWAVRSEFHAKLLNIREAFGRIVAGRRADPDLFQRFFEERVSEIDALITRAADRGELELDRRHTVGFDALADSFQGKSKDIFRAVHLFRDNDFFFVWSRHFFYRMFELVQQKKVKGVRRLMVLGDDRELDESRAQLLMRFHATNAGYAYKVIRDGDFKHVVHDYKIDCPSDFGVYGDRYVYVARSNVPVEPLEKS